MNGQPDYAMQSRVVAAVWYQHVSDLQKDGVLIDLQPLAAEIEKALESAHSQGYQMAQRESAMETGVQSWLK